MAGGFPDFTYPQQLVPSDEEFRAKYNATAETYEEGLRWLFDSFQESEQEVREKMVDLMRLRAGGLALEIGCGTGRDSELIANRLGPTGTLYASDLSVGMMAIMAGRVPRMASRVNLLICNAANLPFADRTFDATFHFGGINQFGDIRSSLYEMARVTKLGGYVVVGDEGVPPWMRDREMGRILINANPLYRCSPPLSELPPSVREVTLRWLLGDAFYVIDFRVAAETRKVDLDLPIPGRRDSLRSRYVAAYGKEPELF